MMAACFEDVVETYDVAFDVGVRVLYTIAHARLSSEIDDDVEMVLLEKVIDEGFVGEVAFYELVMEIAGRACNDGFVKGCYLAETVLFQRDIVIVVQAVKTDDVDVFSGLQQSHDKIGTDEAG